MADRFDPPRAAWIAHALKPLNPEDRPANPIAADQPLPKPARFPSPATKAEAWTRAPVTRVLPNLWIVLGYKNGRLVVNVKGGVIPDPLATGPDPSPSANVDQLGIDDGMKWMVDFDAAEKAGMGIRAKLTREDAAAGLDFLLVLGIKDSPDADDRLDAAAGGTVQRAPLHRWAELRAARAHLPTTRRMRRPASARTIPATKRAIWPNALLRHFNPATDRMPMC